MALRSEQSVQKNWPKYWSLERKTISPWAACHGAHGTCGRQSCFGLSSEKSVPSRNTSRSRSHPRSFFSVTCKHVLTRYEPRRQPGIGPIYRTWPGAPAHHERHDALISAAGTRNRAPTRHACAHAFFLSSHGTRASSSDLSRDYCREPCRAQVARSRPSARGEAHGEAVRQERKRSHDDVC